jgi:hypothetical protein
MGSLRIFRERVVLMAEVEEFVAQGANGVLRVSPGKVAIQRRALGTQWLKGKGNKEVRMSQISGIEYRAASPLADGYIRLLFSGGRQDSFNLHKAREDENTVVFHILDGGRFRKAKELIEQYLADADKPQVVVAQGAPSAASEIEALAGLRDKGIITAGEFEAKKKQLLGL